MKIQSTAKLQIIAKGEPTKSLDQKSTYYKVTVLQGAEAGQLSVSEDIYNLLNVGETTALVLEYNDQYKSLRVVNIDYNAMAVSHSATTVPAPDVPAPDSPASAPTDKAAAAKAGK